MSDDEVAAIVCSPDERSKSWGDGEGAGVGGDVMRMYEYEEGAGVSLSSLSSSIVWMVETIAGE